MISLLAVTMVPFGAYHNVEDHKESHNVPSDFITCVDSTHYSVTLVWDLGVYIYVVMHDKRTDTSSGYLCDLADAWVYPKFYPDEVAEKSIKIPRP